MVEKFADILWAASERRLIVLMGFDVCLGENCAMERLIKAYD
jgi:hypothetical protein